MEFFDKAKIVRLRTRTNKYLVACPDKVSVAQSRDGSSENALWKVEISDSIYIGVKFLRLTSCYRKYLTATNIPTCFKDKSRRVIQCNPSQPGSDVEWRPMALGPYVQIKSQLGLFLCANRGFFRPWRKNTVSHRKLDRRCCLVDSLLFLWQVEVVEMIGERPLQMQMWQEPIQEMIQNLADPMPNLLLAVGSPPSWVMGNLEGTSSSGSEEIRRDPSTSKSRRKVRDIYYAIGDDYGDVEDGTEEASFEFKGTSIETLKRQLQEQTGMEDIVVCFREPVADKLCPFLLPLPPGTSPRHVILIKSSSAAAKHFANGKFPAQEIMW